MSVEVRLPTLLRAHADGASSVSADGATVGEEAVLMGRQGDQEISATELADRAGTISWEITTRIGSRVRRVYLHFDIQPQRADGCHQRPRFQSDHCWPDHQDRDQPVLRQDEGRRPGQGQ